MTTKKQTKTKKEKQATVIEPTHKNPEVLKQLYVDEKKSAGEISRIFKVSRGAVLAQLRKHGIKITTRKTRKPGSKDDYKKKAWLTSQLKKGISIFQIAKQQGVSYASVRNQAMKLCDAHIIEEGRKVRKQKKQKPKITTKK
jgi:DNA-binding CsgD family transcriptional regulator